MLTGHTATNTRVDDGERWMSATVAPPPPYPWEMAGTAGRFRCRCQWYPERRKGISIGGGQADALMLEKGSSFTLTPVIRPRIPR